MDHASVKERDYLAEDPFALPLDKIDVGRPILFQHDAIWPYFERLRREAPVHYCDGGIYGPYWSITKYKHIMQIEANHEVFSSDVKYGGITMRDQMLDFVLPMFIAMDPPAHDLQRAAVEPIMDRQSLAELEILIRARARRVLDELPVNEPFDWVGRVSIELTTQLLATLFDFPWQDRAKLTRWSDVATAIPGAGIIESDEQRKVELLECLQYFLTLWNERVNAPRRRDLISMMAHAEATRHQGPMEYLGNILLLIVGGNDTTRNSITGGLYALNKFPDEYGKLLANRGLVPNMVPEMIRWQTPLAHMRRTATRDFEFEGQKIHAGDRVVLWYVSGNVDDEMIADGRRLIIERDRPRRHLSFGFGLHRCLGERLADLQLRIVWEEILSRFGRIEVLAEPKRIFSTFVKGYSELIVRIPETADYRTNRLA
jgi:cytochrome P450